MRLCFDRFEDRQTPDSFAYSDARELSWRFLATISLMLGAGCCLLPWTASLNLSAHWFVPPLVPAETCACLGLALLTIDLWQTADLPNHTPHAGVSG